MPDTVIHLTANPWGGNLPPCLQGRNNPKFGFNAIGISKKELDDSFNLVIYEE